MNSVQFLRVTTNADGFFSAWSNSYEENVESQASLSQQVTHHERRVAILTNNPLSYYWKGRITGILPLYISGIVGYAFSVVVRVCELVKYIFDLIMDPFIDDRSYSVVFKEKFISLMGGVASLGSALVGLVMPPLAYKIDEWIQSYYSVYSNHATKWMTVPKGAIDVDDPVAAFQALWNPASINVPNRDQQLFQNAKAIYTHFIIQAVRRYKFTKDDVFDPEKMEQLRKLTCLLCLSETENGQQILTALLKTGVNFNRDVFANLEDYKETIRSNIDAFIQVWSGAEPLLSNKAQAVMSDLHKFNGIISSRLREFDTQSLRAASESVNKEKESWGRFLLRPFWFV